MKIKLSLGDRIFNCLNIIFMCFLSLITVYPFLYVLFASFSDPAALSRLRGPLFYPMNFSVRGYEAVLAMGSFWMGYRNSIFYLVVGTVISMTLSVLGAYVLSIKGPMLRKPFMALIIIAMYFSGGMVPTYLIVKQMGITGTVWAMLLPSAVSTYNIIVLRTSFQGIPVSLMESAEIDGANYATMLVRIYIPLSMAALATITLFYAVSRWGEWYNAMVYLSERRDLYPLQMFLRELLVEENNISSIAGDFAQESANYYLLKEVIKYAAVVVATVPILVVYPFLQKYFIKGVMLGSLKE